MLCAPRTGPTVRGVAVDACPVCPPGAPGRCINSHCLHGRTELSCTRPGGDVPTLARQFIPGGVAVPGTAAVPLRT